MDAKTAVGCGLWESSMCDVLIIQREKSCHVFCECGFVKAMLVTPDHCPACGAAWDQPRFQEDKKPAYSMAS
jgi:hypothetical protein